MAARCATVPEFVALVPEFVSTGTSSTGSLLVAVQPAPGDTITLEDPLAFPPVVETYTAGTEFAVGGTAEITAANIAGALSLGALVTATTSGALVYASSVKTGAAGDVAVQASDPASLTWDADTLQNGDALVLFALETACSMLNAGCWGAKKSNASIFLAAHFLTIAAGGGEVGPVTRKKIDKIEVSFAAATAATADAFGSTSWGRMYLALRSTLFVAPIAARYRGFIR